MSSLITKEIVACSHLCAVTSNTASDDTAVFEPVRPRHVTKVVVIGADIQRDSVECDGNDIVA